MQKSILVINGPGLGDMDTGDSDRYGGVTLPMIRDACAALCDELGLKLDFRQTDDQQELFTWLTKISSEADAVVVNPVGYGRAENMDFDAYCGAVHELAMVKKPIAEVHLSNIYNQDVDVRLPRYKPGGEMGFVSGFGVDSYLLAIRSLAEKFKNS